MMRLTRRAAAPAFVTGTLLVVVLGSAACGGTSVTPPEDIAPAAAPASGGVPWPAPADPLELARKAGLTPQTKEFFDYHVHAHLDVFVNGEPVVVPAGLGIAIDDPAVHQGTLEDGSTSYGGIDPPCEQPCISPLHTHDNTGLIHTESSTSEPNRLGQLFTQWDVRLDSSCVGGYCSPDASVLVYVDGRLYEDDPAGIELTDAKQISIAIGTPPAEIPARFPS
jgi:hypothetical protein